MNDLAKLVVTMEANTARFQKEMDQTNRRLDRFASRSEASLRNLRNAFIGLGVGAVLRDVVKSADAIGDSARRVDMTARAYQELRYAASQLDVEHGELDAALVKFNKTLGDARRGSAEAAKAFADLGLDPGKFRDADEAFRVVTQSLGKVEDSFVRSSLQAQIFGREAGPKLADFLGASAEAVERLRREAHTMGAVLSDETIAKADEAAKRLDVMATVIRVQLSEAALNVAPVLTGAANTMAFLAKHAGEAFKQVQSLADELSRAAAFGEFYSAMGEGRFDPTATNERHRQKVQELRDTYAELGQAIARVEAQGGASAETRIKILRDRQAEIQREINALTGKRGAAASAVTGTGGGTGGGAEQIILEPEKWGASVERAAAQASTSVEKFYSQASNSVADQAARNIQSFTASMVDAALAGEDMGDAIVASLRRIAAEVLTVSILQGIGGAMQKSDSAVLQGIGKAIVGARADGGPVAGGSTYLVGEQGPELFVPRVSGTIVPNGAGLSGVTITQHIDARGADPASAANIIRAVTAANQKLKAEIYEEQRRGYAPR